MATDITSDEQEQILQTIDMFELIAQTNPDDYQSLNLLRDAYAKLERKEDLHRIDLALGKAYLNLGQYQTACARLQSLLEDDPDNSEAKKTLQEAKEGLNSMATLPDEGSSEEDIALDFASISGIDEGLIKTGSTVTHETTATAHGSAVDLPQDDGNEALAKFLLSNDLTPAERLGDCLQKTREINSDFSPTRVNTSLLEQVTRESTEDEQQNIFAAVLDHCKYGYIPLDHYDVDRQILHMLPEEITLGRLIVPFDLISRTMMIAMCNPFDAPGKTVVQANLDYHILWYFTTPAAITKALRNGYRIKK